MTTYSQNDDLLVSIELPRSFDVGRYVQDAADEIDSIIGRIYTTPVSMDPAGPTERHSRLLLHRLNNHLASGRILLSIASPIEQSQMHAYGAALVRDALAALQQIAAGVLLLDGAPRNDATDAGGDTVSIANHDAQSIVSVFEQAFMGSPTDLCVPQWRPGDGTI